MSDKKLILQVEILDGDQVVETLELDGDKIKVGKLTTSQLQLDDPKVSRIHAVLERQGDGTYLAIDLGSASGTYVNGKKITKEIVHGGDEVRFGTTTVRLQIIDLEERAAAEAAAAAPAPIPEGHIQLEDGTVVEPYSLEGYYDESNNYIPGYYDDTGAYHYGYGYHDDEGTWQVAHGFYDPDGEWIPTDAPEGEQVTDTELYTDNFFHGQPGKILEIAYLWTDRVLDVQSFKKPRTIFVGGHEKNDYVLEDSMFGNPRYPLVVFDDERGYRLNFSDQMSGTIQREGQQLSLQDAISRGMASPSKDVKGAYTLPLARGTSVRLDFGKNTFLLHFAPLPALAGGAFGMDKTPFMYQGISLGLHIAFMALIFTLPDGYGGLELHDFSAHDRFVELATPPEEEEEEEEEAPDWMDEAEDDDSPDDSEEIVEEEVEIEDSDDMSDVELQEAEDRAVAQDTGALAAFENSMPMEAMGGEALAALANLDGDAQIAGVGGLDLAGGGRHGTDGEAGVGRAATGVPGGTGDAPDADLGPHEGLEPELILDVPETTGALDREIIQRVVRQHRREIQHCYEQQLQRNRDLAGRITMQWVIAGNGSVVTASVEETTMNNSAVERCMAQRIQRWSFPEPEGGGIVRVNYPFNFSS